MQTILLLIDDDLSQDDVYFHVTAYHNNLRNKVWTLIDNYCDHKNLEEDSRLVKTCIECGEIFHLWF